MLVPILAHQLLSLWFVKFDDERAKDNHTEKYAHVLNALIRCQVEAIKQQEKVTVAMYCNLHGIVPVVSGYFRPNLYLSLIHI